MDSVHQRAHDPDVLDPDVVGLVDVDPVLAAHHRHVAHRHLVRPDHDAAAHDRAVLADQPLSVVEHERALMDARGQPDERGQGRPGDPECTRERDRRGCSERRPGAPELAAVLRVGQAQEREDRVAVTCATIQAAAKNQSACSSGAPIPSSRTAAIVRPSSSRPTGSATQPA